MSATGDKKPGGGLDMAALRSRLNGAGDIWRSLDELADTDEFRRFVDAEFPALAAQLPVHVDRRTLLKLMGASLSLAGLAACSPAENIMPYVRQPENVIPGKPRYYATALSSGGFGIGALVESHEGRPTKVEGNPDHPSSLGATDAVMQAVVLSLFDPERSRTPLKNGEPVSYDRFLGRIAALSSELSQDAGQDAALLIEAGTSPTLKAQVAALKTRYPRLRVFRHDPLAPTGAADATRRLSGQALTPVYRLDRADVIVSLDADFLGEGPGRLAYARAFADRRRVRAPGDTMNRLYAFETTPTITGASADHRLAVRPRAVPDMAAALKAAIFDQNAPASAAPELTRAMVDDLTDAGPNALVIAGDHQPPFVHAAALAINSRLGALGNTVVLIEPPDAMPVDGDLADFCAVALAGDISSAIVLGANPLHTASADLDFRKAFAILREVIHWGLYDDETAAVAHWHVPAAHELESWSDIRAHDGTVSIVQPLIAPLYRGITAHEFLAALGGDFASDAMALVHATWADRLDDDAWRKALRDGVVPDSSSPPITIPPVGDIADFETAAPANNTVEILFVADPWLGDGRNANSAWLQELPRPLTKLVWGNAALISPRMAQRLGVENGQVVAIARSGKSLDAPVWILPGQPDNVVTLSTGFGRRRGGAVSQLSGGYDAFQLRTADAPWIAEGATITVKDNTARVLTTQHHQAMEGRAIVRHATLDEFSANPDFVREHVPPPPTESVYRQWKYDEEAWGMAIDQTACIGCMACVSACQSENNIATVGPDECAVGHEMHWLRVDRYYEGPVDAPDTYFQPVPCMHCEKAPCEVVCPVNATVHTHDGLNAQIYNRCVGTRYCSQNCPYKVRRFNFLEYQEFDKAQAGPQQAVHNPDVSVRSRGVMEKCTYCVQRISEKRIGAQIDGRAIEDGEVVTACQQACPTQAISFGNLNDKQAKVVAEKAAPHNYALLEELNTRPRTTYLGRLTNPNTNGERGDG